MWSTKNFVTIQTLTICHFKVSTKVQSKTGEQNIVIQILLNLNKTCIYKRMNSRDIITTLSNNFTKNTQTTQTEQYILLGRRRRTEGYKKSKTTIDCFIILCWQRKEEEKGQQREETRRGKSIVFWIIISWIYFSIWENFDNWLQTLGLKSF